MSEAQEVQNELFGLDDAEYRQLIDNLDKVPPADAENAGIHWPEYLQDLVDVHQATLKSQGFEPEQCLVLARKLIAAQAHYLGGLYRYLPTADKLKKALRDIEIFQQLGRKSARELALKHKLTEKQVYLIAATQKQIYLKRTQRELF